MKATEQLKAEHEGIKLMMKILNEMCEKLELGERVDPGHLKQVVEFFKVFVDKCHHFKEEELLFPALLAAGFPEKEGPVGVMLAEHEQGRAYIREIAEGVEAYLKGDKSAVSRIAKNARVYSDLLTEHILKENTMLFPMVNKAIHPEKRKRIFEGFEKIERERIGPGKHEEFHHLMEHLEGVYLAE